MQRMADEIVDQDRVTAHAQCLFREACQLVRLQVMCEQTATHQIEAAICKGKHPCIGHNCALPVFIPQM